MLEGTHGEAKCDGCSKKIPDSAPRVIVVERNLATVHCKDCAPGK